MFTVHPFSGAKLDGGFVLFDEDSHRAIGFFFNKDIAQDIANYLSGILPITARRHNGHLEVTIKQYCIVCGDMLEFTDVYSTGNDLAYIRASCPKMCVDNIPLEIYVNTNEKSEV